MAARSKSETLVASAARTATGTGDAVCQFDRYEKFIAASGTSPTLDVTIGGTTPSFTFSVKVTAQDAD